MLTRRRRNKFRRKLSTLYPHVILSKSDQFLRNLSLNHITSIIIVGFLVIFAFLAFFLPRDPVHKTFVKIDDTMDAIIPDINLDPEGHVQIFYYPWYGNPQHDHQYIHWNHDILPHWDGNVNKKYKIGEKYNPLHDEIGASYYPLFGAYSSSDKSIIQKHFAMLLDINVTVIVVSWHSPIAILNNPDNAFSEKDKITASNLDVLFAYASVHGIKIAIHLEPYNGRTAESTYKDLKYLQETYSHLNGYYTSAKHNNKPFYYIYDSYKMEDNEWKKLLIKGYDDTLCVRDTDLDGVFLGLYLNKNPSERHILQSGFDGFYTYFAADGFTDGSSPKKHWKHMAQWALQHRLIFVPSIGPGYNDLRVRPWNGANTKSRDKGEYYKMFWNQVLDINSNLVKEMKQEKNENEDDADVKVNDDLYAVIEYVSITSFNEWHEGTQIEPSVAKTSTNGYKYMDFEAEGGPDAYMEMTRVFVNSFLKQL